MINDIGYLESGFSEEFSNSIGLNGQSDELLNEGLISSLKKMFTKAKGKRSDVKANRHARKENKPVTAYKAPDPITKKEQEIIEKFIDDFYSKSYPLVSKIIKKYPKASKVLFATDKKGANIYEDIDEMINYGIDSGSSLTVAHYDVYMHPDIENNKAHGRHAHYDDMPSIWEDDEFSEQFNACTYEIEREVTKLGYGDCEYGGDWDDGPWEVGSLVTPYKEFKKKYLEDHPVKQESNIFDFVFGNAENYAVNESSPSTPVNINKTNESYYSNGTADIDLDYYAAYESYLATNIYNETKIQNMLVTECGLSESAIILEARTQDDVSNNWERFLNFIGRVYDRFVAAYEKHVMSNKKFLEKYKDNIVNTKGSDDVDYEYTGDYFEGINRIQNTQLPVFNYERDAQWLRQEGYEGAIKDFMAGKNFKYDPEKDMAEQFKNWFMAAERGTSKGKLSGLNFKVMFDFCYNYDTLKNSIERDIKGLRQSKNLLINAVNKEMRERGQDPNKQNNQQNNQPNNSAQQNNQNSNPQTNVNTNNNNNTGGGATAKSEAVWLNINEADDNANGNNNDNNNSNSNNGGLTISNSDNETKDANGNTVEKKNKIPGKTNSVDQDIKNIVNKWTKMCRCFLTAKLTITQLIGKDFMNLIRAHLRAQNVDTSGEDENNQQNNDNNNNQNQQNNNNQNNNNNTGNNQQNNKNNNG